jgi:glycosyltransferase involved in cell wall biosynthesis
MLTLLHKRGSVSRDIERVHIRPTWLNRLPQVEKYYRYLLPMMPFVAGWRIDKADLVLSFSHCVAKSAIPPPGVPHVCHCFTPMRYAWHMKDAYFRPTGLLARLKVAAFDRLMAALREWDRRTADRVTHFIANSKNTQQRIKECYNRESTVIYSPVDTDFYTPATPTARCEDFYLVVSALAPYKRFDLAVDACMRLGRRLVLIGAGQDYAKLKAAAGPKVEFLGWQPDEVIRDYLRRAKALLFPGEEDFGIVPLEAQACGCPVIAYGRGGVLETVRPLGVGNNPTGVFFEEQTDDAVAAAIEQFERNSDRFDPRSARQQALLFRKERFETELFGFLDRVLAGEPDMARKAA